VFGWTSHSYPYGGRVVVPPYDIPHVGRLSVLADPYGATFTVMTRSHDH
jgi:uncharacterized protein